MSFGERGEGIPLIEETPHASRFVENVEAYHSCKDPYDIEYKTALQFLDSASRTGKRTITYNPVSGEQHFDEVLRYLKSRFTPELGYRVEYVETGVRRVNDAKYNLLYRSIVVLAIRISF